MVRLGVVGYGLRMDGLVKESFRKADPDVRVVGIVDLQREKVLSRLDECDRKDVVFYDNLDEMVRKGRLDALAIGTRCNTHTPLAIEAAKYGLPLFLEKPVAITMEQAVELEHAYENCETPVLVSFPLRVSSLCRLMREYIEKGSVGRPEHILANNYVPYGRVYWEMEYRNFNITQGLFLQKATHDFDYMSYLMGAKIVRVAAMWTRNRIFGGNKAKGLSCSTCKDAESCLENPSKRYRLGLTSEIKDHPCVFSIDCGTEQSGMNEDSSSALLEFDSGVHGVYTQVFYSMRKAARRGATVSGYNGTLDFDWYRNDLRLYQHHRPFDEVVKADEGMAHFGGDLELAYNFIGMIQGKEKPSSTIRDGLRSVYACLAAKRSAEMKDFVDVRQIGASS